jgi:flagellar hook assembly protein FlgD
MKLYWAGLQGSISNGADTQIVLISAENITSVDDNVTLPATMTLSQNYPNPVNSETMIDFTIANPGTVTLEISNILGQRVYIWSEYVSQSGQIRLRWDGKTESGIEAPSGVYFYRLLSGESNLVKRMILLR